jgi:hypothetical protein
MTTGHRINPLEIPSANISYDCLQLTRTVQLNPSFAFSFSETRAVVLVKL